MGAQLHGANSAGSAPAGSQRGRKDPEYRPEPRADYASDYDAIPGRPHPLKVLAVCVPGAGHINPLLPLIEAFGRQGDRIVVASGSDIASSVERAGAELCPA